MIKFLFIITSNRRQMKSMAAKAAMAAMLVIFCSACKSSYEISKIDPEKDFHTQNQTPGLVYALPSTYYQLQIKGQLQETLKGRLSEFNHLVKYPSGVQKQSNLFLQIDSVALKAYNKPDLQQMYSLKLPEGSGLFSKSPTYKMQLAENLMLAGTDYSDPIRDTFKQPSCHLINSGLKIPDQLHSNQPQQENAPFEQQSLKRDIEQLGDLNQDLVAQLKNTRNDSILAKDSVVQARLKKMEKSVDDYLGRIRKIKSLFEAYRGENLAEKAQKFSDIIHKLVELKTTLAGGDAAIDYPNTAITPMIASIDSMIENYLAPFKARSRKQTLSWGVTFEPSEDSLHFRYGIFRNGQNGYYIDQWKGQTDYKAMIAIKIKPESLNDSGSSVEKENQGLVYRIPARAKLEIRLKYPGNGKSIPLAQSMITLPQLGTTNTLPFGKGNRHFRLDPFTGALKSVEQN